MNPFCTSVNPAQFTQLGQSGDIAGGGGILGALTKGNSGKETSAEFDAQMRASRKISLKVMTLSNSKQKVNDALGNPVEIGVAVMWRVVDTAKAVFDVDNYKEYLSLQADTAVRSVAKVYPYDIAPNVDTTGDGEADDGSLRGSTELVAKRIKDEIQAKVEAAGLEIIDARITHLAYSPEIAAVMLQRQQARAVVDARWSPSTKSARPPWSRTCSSSCAPARTPSRSSTPDPCIEKVGKAWRKRNRSLCG